MGTLLDSGVAAHVRRATIRGCMTPIRRPQPLSRLSDTHLTWLEVDGYEMVADRTGRTACPGGLGGVATVTAAR
jgi:hypothetical protein